MQKSEIEKCELNRQLEEMKAQHNCDVFYQKELMKEEEKIKSMVAQVTK